MKSAIVVEVSREGYGLGQIRGAYTVKELIEQLEQYDEDSLVFVSHDNGYTYGSINFNMADYWEDENEDGEWEKMY